MTKTTTVRVPTNIVEQFRNLRAELEGLTYTAVVEVMLRKALDAEINQDTSKRLGTIKQ